MHYLLFLSLFLNDINNIRQIPHSDTTIVGKVIEVDPIVIKDNFGYTGFKYYYGIHHIKVVKLDIHHLLVLANLIFQNYKVTAQQIV